MFNSDKSEVFMYLFLEFELLSDKKFYCNNLNLSTVKGCNFYTYKNFK